MEGQFGRGAEADLSAQLGELQMGESGDMLIDELDPVDEKPDVAIITPEDSAEDTEAEPLADDCNLSCLVLPNFNMLMPAQMRR